MNGNNLNLHISLAVACTVVGGCLVAFFMYAFVTQKEVVAVQVAVPTSMTFNAPADHATPGTAILHGKLERVSESTITFKLSDWVLGRDARAQLAIEDGDCTLKEVEKNGCGQALSLTRDTQKELTLPLIKNPLIKIWERTPDGLQIKRDESGKPTQVTTTLDELKRLLGSEQLAYTPFIIMTSNQEIVALEEQYIP